MKKLFLTLVFIMALVVGGNAAAEDTLVAKSTEGEEYELTPREILNGEDRMQLSAVSFITDTELHVYIYSGLSTTDVVRLHMDFTKVESLTAVRSARLFLNSGGGDAFTGLALSDMLVSAQARGWSVSIEANGIVASAAVPVFAVCSPRYASPGTLFMVHEAAVWKWPGKETASDIDAQQALFKMLRARYMNYLVKNSNLTSDEWREKEKATTWFTASEAKQWGLVDTIR